MNWQQLPPEISVYILSLLHGPLPHVTTSAYDRTQGNDDDGRGINPITSQSSLVSREWAHEARKHTCRKVQLRTTRDIHRVQRLFRSSVAGELPLPYITLVQTLVIAPLSQGEGLLAGLETHPHPLETFWNEAVTILTTLPYLQELVIKSIDVTFACFHALIEQIGALHALRSLTFQGSPLAFSRHARHTTYDMSHFVSHLRLLPQLNFLSLSIKATHRVQPAPQFNLDHITDLQLAYLPKDVDALIRFLSGFPALRSLDLTSARVDISRSDWDQASVSPLTSLFTHLHELRIDMPDHYNFYVTMFLTQPLPNLRQLFVAAAGCFDPELDFFVQMAEAHMPALEELVFEGNSIHPRVDADALERMLSNPYLGSREPRSLRSFTLMLTKGDLWNHQHLQAQDIKTMRRKCAEHGILFVWPEVVWPEVHHPFGL